MMNPHSARLRPGSRRTSDSKRSVSAGPRARPQPSAGQSTRPIERKALIEQVETLQPPYRASPPRLVVKVYSGVTWVRRAGASHLWRHAPDLCDCVLQTVSAAEIEADSGFDFMWLSVAARRADYILLFGDSVQHNSRRLEHLRTRCEVVCCGDKGDARRVTRILALRGDTVLDESTGFAIFSHSSCT